MPVDDVYTSPNASPIREIAAVRVRVPPFWRVNPKLWFSQIESQFINAGITKDSTKYHTLVGSVESDILNAVSHIIESPPPTEMYETLKKALLIEFQESEEKRLQRLLENVCIGDRKPSALLREMRQLSSGKVSDEIMKSLWFQRLPSTIKAILSVSSDSLDKLAEMADKINVQIGDSNINELSNQQLEPSNSRLDQIENQMQNILDRIEALNINQRGRSRSQSVRRKSTRSRGNSMSSTCWYHSNFGAKATRCRSPCSFKSEN